MKKETYKPGWHVVIKREDKQKLHTENIGISEGGEIWTSCMCPKCVAFVFPDAQ